MRSAAGVCPLRCAPAWRPVLAPPPLRGGGEDSLRLSHRRWGRRGRADARSPRGRPGSLDREDEVGRGGCPLRCAPAWRPVLAPPLLRGGGEDSLRLSHRRWGRRGRADARSQRGRSGSLDREDEVGRGGCPLRCAPAWRPVLAPPPLRGGGEDSLRLSHRRWGRRGRADARPQRGRPGSSDATMSLGYGAGSLAVQDLPPRARDPSRTAGPHVPAAYGWSSGASLRRWS